VGRGSERSGVQAAIEAGRDVVLVGVPGVGKTRLATELDGSVAFLEHGDHGRVVDALVSMTPVAVVVDDAHTRPEDLRVVRQAWVQEDLPSRSSPAPGQTALRRCWPGCRRARRW
jgi:MoxR-like ATPase